MPCFSPLKGYRSRIVNKKTGKRPIVFKPSEGFIDLPVDLPCGQCIGCKLEKSRQWAVRAQHEASLYLHNCFVTLTYSDEFLPKNGSIDPDAPVAFMKRLRKKFGENIRSFGCAEYGEKFQRPHYHLCLFNHDFHDKKPWKKNAQGDQLYLSKDLQDLWPYGYTVLGAMTFESAAYVARYVTKKITGKKVPEHYGDRLPERGVCLSRNPGLGKPWLEKYHKDVYPCDFIIVRGRKTRPVKYYDRRYSIDHPEKFDSVTLMRKKKLQKALQENPDQRLSQREKHLTLTTKTLKRNYEK